MSEEVRPRKKLRKGTRSCMQCRRRKLRCQYSIEQAPCDNCTARHVQCTSQEEAAELYVGNGQTVRSRIGKLERVIEDLVSTSHSRKRSPLNVSSNTSPRLDPLSEITAPGKGGSSSLSAKHSLRNDETQTMRALIPSIQILDTIFAAGSGWWEPWKTFFPYTECQLGPTNLSQYVSRAILSNTIESVSTALLCIAISIQQTPVPLDSDSRLDTIMIESVSTVDRIVASDDRISNTLEGIEVLILQANFYLNYGLTRKSWLTMRRAISFANMLGLNRVQQGHEPLQAMRRKNVWHFMYWTDRHLSFLLGLPYSVVDIHCGIDFEGEVDTVHQYLLRLGNISGHLIDRIQGQIDDSADYASVEVIDKELQRLVLPPQSISMMAGILATATFWYHHIRALNHLPFMLRRDKQFERSATACSESAVEMLRLYPHIRAGSARGRYICKVADFEAFSAAVLLMLSMWNSPGDEHQWKLIDETIALMKEAAKEASGTVAQQSVLTLETLRGGREAVDMTGSLMTPFLGIVNVGSEAAFGTRRLDSVSDNIDEESVPTPLNASLPSQKDILPEVQGAVSSSIDELIQGLYGSWQNTIFDQDWFSTLDNGVDWEIVL